MLSLIEAWGKIGVITSVEGLFEDIVEVLPTVGVFRGAALTVQVRHVPGVRLGAQVVRASQPVATSDDLLGRWLE